jgi:hypothetical protein
MESMSPMTRWDRRDTIGRGSIFSRLLARWKAEKLELKRIQRVCPASQSQAGRCGADTPVRRLWEASAHTGY